MRSRRPFVSGSNRARVYGADGHESLLCSALGNLGGHGGSHQSGGIGPRGGGEVTRLKASSRSGVYPSARGRKVTAVSPKRRARRCATRPGAAGSTVRVECCTTTADAVAAHPARPPGLPGCGRRAWSRTVGRMNTKSNGPSSTPTVGSRWRTFARQDALCARRPEGRQVGAKRAQGRPIALDQDDVRAAPRDSASTPAAPVPARSRSRTGAPACRRAEGTSHRTGPPRTRSRTVCRSPRGARRCRLGGRRPPDDPRGAYPIEAEARDVFCASERSEPLRKRRWSGRRGALGIARCRTSSAASWRASLEEPAW